jgi:hypothetical protein
VSAALRADDCAERLTPCPCEWCKRYGNPDASNGIRPSICNRHSGEDVFGGKLHATATYLEMVGRCTRCHYQLGDEAYLVREQVQGTSYFHKDDVNFEHPLFATVRSTLVPVCRMCTWDEELAHNRYWVNCAGCDRRLSVPRWKTGRVASLMGGGHPTRHTCNNACLRRALRKKRRVKDLTCTVCKEEFASARKDAKYCSGACRQWAYRLREFAAVSP